MPRRNKAHSLREDDAAAIYDSSLSVLGHADFLSWCRGGTVPSDDEPQINETVEQAQACSRLLLMLLRMAVIDLVVGRNSSDPQKLSRSEDALFWFLHPDPCKERAPYLLSFPSVCAILGLDPDALRERVLRMTMDDLKQFYVYKD